MDWQTLLSLALRKALVWLGGVLVAHGYLQSGAMEAFVGGGMTIAGVFWAWWQQKGQTAAFNELSIAYDRLLRRSAPKPAAPATPQQP